VPYVLYVPYVTYVPCVPYVPYMSYVPHVPYMPYAPYVPYVPYMPYVAYAPYVPYVLYVRYVTYVPCVPYVPYVIYVPYVPYVPYVSFQELSDARSLRDVGNVTEVKTSGYCTRQTDRQTQLCGFRSCCGTKNFCSQTPISDKAISRPAWEDNSKRIPTNWRASSFPIKQFVSRPQSGAHTANKASIAYNKHRRNPTVGASPCISKAY
jgi:hypothetical protein